MTHQIGHATGPSYVDKRRDYRDDFESRVVVGGTIFTANGAGTTTTIVGADADITDSTNVVRIGEEFKLFDSDDELIEETVFRITEVASDAGDTTVTFTPAAASATASGDYIRLVRNDPWSSTGNKDRRLIELGFDEDRVASMTENDKDYQLRVSDDPGSL